MKVWVLLLLTVLMPARADTIYTDVPETPESTKIYLFYLHGRIIENSGPRPTDPRYGLYDYPAILEALSSRGAVVISAQRPSKTDMNEYAGIVVSQVEKLIERGVPPGNIVVIGFSKGGAITTRVSSFLRRPQVRFVLLAACPGGSAAQQISLTGQVLSVYEESDTLAGSCKPLADQSEQLRSFNEFKISTGKLHGAFYMPLTVWLDPLLDWVHGVGG
ncbi:MAG: alpha/beta hydrolase [Gammaproteobacteria bacterium]|nr:alpha/beta hydrolase [Gammaproteobacteria bacterium]MBU1554791.1 alpha/beta hydrolase [Gammaproteobacteria bacterium]MBU2069370.1 alpha/beta hydrolase [Gammaproteobacteria bacterium]MBU2184428.1 alpha/beta hydrolase [Gammaproteobacteria bacterium]MBU2203081.1 alpha/beta hydrolase [Gammaproteobacteria bacterium]